MRVLRNRFNTDAPVFSNRASSSGENWAHIEFSTLSQMGGHHKARRASPILCGRSHPAERISFTCPNVSPADASSVRFFATVKRPIFHSRPWAGRPRCAMAVLIFMSFALAAAARPRLAVLTDIGGDPAIGNRSCGRWFMPTNSRSRHRSPARPAFPAPLKARPREPIRSARSWLPRERCAYSRCSVRRWTCPPGACM